MNPSSTSSGAPEFSYIFQVNIQVNRIFCPLANFIEMPPRDQDWAKPDCRWVAKTARRIYEFLSDKNPIDRYKLETEVEIATQMNRLYPFWFRNRTVPLHDGPHTKTKEEREDSMQSPESLWFPYITSGVKNLIEECLLPRTPCYWTPASLRTTIDMNAKYIIITFDITDLNNVAYAVIDERRDRKMTMKELCLLECGQDIEDEPVIELLEEVPVIKSSTTQMFLEDDNLFKWAEESVNQKKDLWTLVGNDQKGYWIHNRPNSSEEPMNTFSWDGSQLSKSYHLICPRLKKTLASSASQIVWLALAIAPLQGGEDDDIKTLIFILASLPKLEEVYIMDDVVNPLPGIDLPRAHAERAKAQVKFFDRVGFEYPMLLKKLSASSMYSCRLSPMLKNAMLKNATEPDEMSAEYYAERMEEIADIYFQ